MKRKKKRHNDIVRYRDWLRVRDVYPDLTFGEFLRNGPDGNRRELPAPIVKTGSITFGTGTVAEAKSR